MNAWVIVSLPLWATATVLVGFAIVGLCGMPHELRKPEAQREAGMLLAGALFFLCCASVFAALAAWVGGFR